MLIYILQHAFMQKETTYIDTIRINIFNPLKPKLV
jgi:hypothetical protein